MYTFLGFRTEAKKNYKRIMKDKPRWYRPLPYFDDEVRYAWGIYENARKTSLSMLILGKSGIRAKTELLLNFGVTSKTPSKLFKGELHTGSILSEKFWWPFFNDAWVLGGIHSLTPFYLSMNELQTDELWDKNENRPTVLGREIIGLIEFGYRRVKYGHEKALGIVMAPGDKSKALAASLTEYHKAIDRFADAQSIIKSLDSVQYGKYVLPGL